MVRTFFTHGHMLKEINGTYIALIPKVNKPDNESRYRPISLCNI